MIQFPPCLPSGTVSPIPSTLPLYTTKIGRNTKTIDAIKKTVFWLNFLERKEGSSFFINEKHNVTTNPETNHVFLTIKSVGTSLERYLEEQDIENSLAKTAALTRQIVGALAFLECSNILFPTITPLNISTNGEKVKLTDLEQLSFKEPICHPDEKELELSPYTLFYVSPEFSSRSKTITNASHIWNVGLITAQIFLPQIKALIPQSTPPEELFSCLKELLTNASRARGEKEKIVSNVLELLSTLFLLEPKDRPTTSQLLQHPLLQGDILFPPFVQEEEHPHYKGFSTDSAHALSPLGRGSFGLIYKGYTAQAHPCVFKINKDGKKGEECWTELLREDAFLRLLKNRPGIIQRYDILEAHEENTLKICLSLEQFPNSLAKILKNYPNGFPLSTIKGYAKQLVNALQTLAELGIIHLDIKPENILVSFDLMQLVLADFGSACFTDSTCLLESSYLVTRCYRPPEVLLEIPLTSACDLWGLGVTLAQCFTDKTLFPATTHTELPTMHETVLDKKYPPHLVALGSPEGQIIYQKSSSLKRTFHPIYRLNDLLQRKHNYEKAHPQQLQQLTNLFYSLLTIEPQLRPSPRKVLEHAFFDPFWNTASAYNREWIKTLSTIELSKRDTATPRIYNKLWNDLMTLVQREEKREELLQKLCSKELATYAKEQLNAEFSPTTEQIAQSLFTILQTDQTTT